MIIFLRESGEFSAVRAMPVIIELRGKSLTMCREKSYSESGSISYYFRPHNPPSLV